jgi:hypothetical protein
MDEDTITRIYCDVDNLHGFLESIIRPVAYRGNNKNL